MLEFIFLLLLGLVSPSHSATTSNNNSQVVTANSDTPDTPDTPDGPGGETGNNPPR